MPSSPLSAQSPFASQEAKAHYADITGEVHWVVQMKSRYGARALEAGVCLCSLCGYDCVPAELSLALLHEELEDRRLAPLREVETVFHFDDAGAPRGTLLTVLGLVGGPAAAREFLEGLNAFVPDEERGAVWRSLLRWCLPAWSSQARAFTVPNCMGVVNIACMHTTAAALGCPVLRVRDRQLLGGRNRPLLTLLVVAALYSAAALCAPLIAVGFVLLSVAPVRDLAARALAYRSYGGNPHASVTVYARGKPAPAAVDPPGADTVELKASPSAHITAT